MGLDISIKATKDDKDIDLGVWKGNWVLLETLEEMGLVKDNNQEIEVDSDQLYDLETNLRDKIGKVDLGKYEIELDYTSLYQKDKDVKETWNDTALVEGGKGWKWLFNAKVKSENGWKILIWWWY